MKSFYGASIQPILQEARPTPKVEPVDDESLLVNTAYPERFGGWSAKACVTPSEARGCQ